MRRSAAAFVAVAALAAAAVLGAAIPAAAEDVTAAELRELAAEARTDAAALERLRGVDAVGGRPVDVRTALAGASGDDLDARLAQLAEPPVVAAGDRSAATDRKDAADVLSGRRYHPVEAPKPFEGVLRRLGGWLEPIFSPVGDALDEALGVVPAGLWALGAIVVAALFAAALGRRRVTVGGPGVPSLGGHEAELDPRVLDAAADEAERAGDLQEAYRLRFRAGVLRLHRTGALEDAPSRTTAALAQQLHSTRFAHLARDFDQVAYGERPVSPDDLAEVRAEWGAVLEEAGRR